MSSLPFGSSAGQWRASLVMRSGAVDAAVVLGHVEIDRPWAASVGHRLVGRPEFLLAVAFLEQRVFRRVVTQQIKIGMGQVRLKADGHRHADRFQ